jgi:hypothetical protein
MNTLNAFIGSSNGFDAAKLLEFLVDITRQGIDQRRRGLNWVCKKFNHADLGFLSQSSIRRNL